MSGAADAAAVMAAAAGGWAPLPRRPGVLLGVLAPVRPGAPPPLAPVAVPEGSERAVLILKGRPTVTNGSFYDLQTSPLTMTPVWVTHYSYGDTFFCPNKNNLTLKSVR